MWSREQFACVTFLFIKIVDYIFFSKSAIVPQYHTKDLSLEIGIIIQNKARHRF